MVPCRRGHRVGQQGVRSHCAVSIGNCVQRRVKAVVIGGDSRAMSYLGMNVLSKFEIDQRENLLILRSIY